MFIVVVGVVCDIRQKNTPGVNEGIITRGVGGIMCEVNQLLFLMFFT